MICDSHVHFFSPGFFAGLGANRSAITALGWEFPESTEALAAQWIDALDRHGVTRAALMASLPGDADSVAKAVALNPSRFVGFFMLDPTRQDAIDYAKRALDEGLRTICLFPAMHGYPLHDSRVSEVFDLAASRRGGTVDRVAVFVHCGVLSVGIRKKLGLPSPFDIRFGNPLDLHGVALQASDRADHHSALRRGDAARSADARGRLPERASRHVELELVDQVHAGPDARERVQDRARCASGPIACCSAPIHRSFRGDGTARSTRSRNRRSTPSASSAAVQQKIFGDNFARLFAVETAPA